MVQLAAPVHCCKSVTDQLDVADLLQSHVYGRMPLGLQSMLHQRRIVRHSPLNQRTCAAVEPSWFVARVRELKQLRRDEHFAEQLQQQQEEDEEDDEDEEEEDEEEVDEEGQEEHEQADEPNTHGV